MPDTSDVGASSSFSNDAMIRRLTQVMDLTWGMDDIAPMTADISLAGEYAEHEVEATFEERVIDVASDYETLVAECVSDLGLPP